MADTLLDLTTLTERPVIAINRKRYEILSPDEMCIVDYHRFQQWGIRIDEMMKLAELGDDQADELSGLVRKLTDRIMVGVPDDVRAKLTESQRLLVAQVFTELSPQTTLKRKKKASRSTGAKRQRGSNGSTAATPPAG